MTYSETFKIKNQKHDFKVVRVWGKWPIWVKHLIFGVKLLNLASGCETIFALNVWSAGFPSLIVSKLLKKKFVVRIAGDYAWEVGAGNNKVSVLIDDFQKTKKKGWNGILYKLQGWICKKAGTIIVPSKYLAGIVVGWGVPDSKIKIIYNGTDFIPSNIAKEEARNKIGIHGNIILSVGRLVQWKGFRMLIKIMPQLLAINQFFMLVIVGDGPEKKILEMMVKNLGLEKKIFITGKKSKEDLAVYLAAADIFVLNTGYEGFSHQILEAMSAGVPMIATAVGGNKEIIRQGENGFMVKYNDEFNLIEAIKTLWKMPDLKEQFIEEGRKTARLFNADNMLKETIQLLSS